MRYVVLKALFLGWEYWHMLILRILVAWKASNWLDTHSMVK